jgi:hypothetical protein
VASHDDPTHFHGTRRRTFVRHIFADPRARFIVDLDLEVFLAHERGFAAGQTKTKDPVTCI